MLPMAENYLDELKLSCLQEKVRELIATSMSKGAHELETYDQDPGFSVGGKEAIQNFSDGRFIRVIVVVTVPKKEQEQNGQ